MKNSSSLSNNPGCLGALFGKHKQKASSFPYQISSKFVSPAELSFYLQAYEILNGRYTICPKVALSELLAVKAKGKSWRSAFNKISQKSVDFVVCETQTMKPLYAIELDDASHDRPDRQKRDDFMDRAFAAAGLALLHVDCKRGYSHEEMVETLLMPLQKRNTPPALPVAAPRTATPTCPTCGAPMRKVAASDGPHAGEYYWRCTKYPQCQTFFPAGERVKK